MIRDKERYLQHINDSEQIITMRKLLDKIERVMKCHTIEITDFFDPYQRRLSYSILNRFQEIKHFDNGGYNEAERKCIIIYPSYLEAPWVDDFIGAIEISRMSKFGELSHRDYLGAVMSLGIKREKIGDIIVCQEKAQIVVHKDILNYIIMNLNKIGNETVKSKEIEIENLDNGIEEYKDVFTTVASPRLDNIVNSVVNSNRKSSSSLITNGKVKVNWQPILQPSFQIKSGDIISVRGYGRFKVLDTLGESKKGRIKIKIRKYL